MFSIELALIISEKIHLLAQVWLNFSNLSINFLSIIYNPVFGSVTIESNFWTEHPDEQTELTKHLIWLATLGITIAQQHNQL